MARKTPQEIRDICKKLKIDKLWSWSRYHTYKEDKWEYFLKYILKRKEDRRTSIYTVSGGNVHDILEKYYTGQIPYSAMVNWYEESLFAMECADLKYDRNDSTKNAIIGSKYESCIRHFFENHIPILCPKKIEHFLLIKIAEDIYMQGYVDMVYIKSCTDEKTGKEKKKVHILDWKTSTIYQGQKIDKECGQLILYAEGIRQLTGITLEDIVCEWNFLKYVTVSYEQKNGTWKKRHIERNKIGESIVNTVAMWLRHFGYDENNIKKYIDKMVIKNSIRYLPQEVQDKFKIADCFVEVPLSEEKIQSLKENIADTVREATEKEKEYNNTKDEKIFWQSVTASDEYRLSVLSGYSRMLHKPYDEYLLKKESKERENNLSKENDKEFLDFITNL